jgi:hypothetical protein
MKTVCIHSSSETLTLYFYDELTPAERADFDAHLATCADCRASIGELQAIRELLSDRAQPERSTREWYAFMRRLDSAIDWRPSLERGVATGDAAPTVASAPPVRRLWDPARGALHAKSLALAATLLLAIAVGLAWQLRHFRAQPAAAPQTVTAATKTMPVKPAGDDALRAAAMRHFERAKLVVLGLAMKDPGSTRPDDWEHERELAASLLPDTRLYRQFAISAGDTRLSNLLGDLETVLLQASMTDEADAPELQRLQRMIRRHDLLERMDTNAVRRASIRGI